MPVSQKTRSGVNCSNMLVSVPIPMIWIDAFSKYGKAGANAMFPELSENVVIAYLAAVQLPLAFVIRTPSSLYKISLTTGSS